VADNPEVYGSALAYAPSEARRAPYWYRAKTALASKDLADGDYRYEDWDWFRRPRQAGGGVWSEPYFDEGGGNCLMVTYSAPWYTSGPERRFRGVLTADVSLTWLTALLARIPLSDEGYAFLLARDGTVVAHPQQTLILRKKMAQVGQERGTPELGTLQARMTGGQHGLFTISRSVVKGARSTVAYAPVPDIGWSLGLVFADRDLHRRVAVLGQTQLLVGTMGFVLLLLVALRIARRIADPLRRLDQAAIALGADLHAPLPEIAGQDEVAELAGSFRRMRDELVRSVAELRVTTAAKQRIESEVAIARSIQMGLVPKTFPPFPKRRDMDLYAVLEPALEVSGDFYDFFLLDDDQLLLAIGDVSGKGVPAALFMAVSRTFLKAVAREASGPGAMLTVLNRELSEDNPTSMFLTLFCGVLDLRTGECRYASGGHDLPLLKRADGSLVELARAGGPLIGALPDIAFSEATAQLMPGDVLLAYTDGITEAMDHAGTLYGKERLHAALLAAGDERVEHLTAALRADVTNFVAGAEQSDDITLLAFRYRGPM
jgi:sigma-B regulation protein RsbU (phosphoserine phosphatase)